MVFSKSLGKAVAVYSGLVGLLYVFFGFIELLDGFGLAMGSLLNISEAVFIPGDPFAGVMLIITGAVYLAGVDSLSVGNREGLSFLAVGVLLSTVLFGLYLAIMGSNFLGYVLGFEDWVGWAWTDDVRPGLWLWFSVIPGILVALKKEWRE